MTGKIIFYGASWCGDCIRAKYFLDSKKIEYEYIDIDKDDSAAEKVIELNKGMKSIPTIIFPNGFILTEPNNSELQEQIEALNHQKLA